MGYSIQIKETVLQKALSGKKTQHEIAKEFGVGKSTIRNWLKNYRNSGGIKLKSKEKRPKDWTPEERMRGLNISIFSHKFYKNVIMLCDCTF